VELQEPGISFSRLVRATVGQMIEVPFQGSGWVYLGELGSRPGIAYSSRRLDPEGQSFVFRAEAAGTYGLKFYKQDFVRDYILNDYVQVIVGDPPEAAAMGWFNPSIDRGRVVAEPRWPTALAEAEAFSRGTSGPSAAPAVIAAVPGTAAVETAVPVPGTSASGAAADTSPALAARADEGPTAVPPAAVQAAPAAQTAAQPLVSQPVRPTLSDEGVIPVRPAASVQPSPGAGAEVIPLEALGNLQPSGYLDRARQEFDAGRVATAISVLDQLRERYPSGTDEAWWLYGQFYEANSPSRDIRTSLDYYRRLVREYPQSSRYNDARRRIAYLERYYINIQ
jgi:TolA-binding protein